MPRPSPIQWPDNAKICVTFIIPWEVWPDNYATRGSLQRVSHPLPPENAVFKQNMAAVTEREYGDRVGIWRIMDMFERHNLKATFLMNGKKVEQFPDECKEFQAQGHEFSSECYEHEYAFMYTREEERKSIQDTVAAFKNVLGAPPTGYLSPGHASTDNTLELVAEAGFVWWADPLNSDIPYTVESGGRKIAVVPYNVPGCNDYSTLRRRANAQGPAPDHEGPVRLPLLGGGAGGAEVLRVQPPPVRIRRALPHQDHRRVHQVRQGFLRRLVRQEDRDRQLGAGTGLLSPGGSIVAPPPARVARNRRRGRARWSCRTARPPGR